MDKARQVLVNLCGNAAKYTEKGEVRLACAARRSRVVFVVSDTGIGIAPEHHGRIFERFWQVDGASTRAAGGMGIGLAAAREYARLLGGDVTVESEVGQRQHVPVLATPMTVPTGDGVGPRSAELRRAGRGFVAVLAGDWRWSRNRRGSSPWWTPRTSAAAPRSGAVRAWPSTPRRWAQWDSSLLVFLEQAHDYCELATWSSIPRGCPTGSRGCWRCPGRCRSAWPTRSRRGPRVTRVGHAAISAWDAWLAALTFTGQVTDGFIRLLLGRVRLRWRDFWVVVQSNGWGALPIVTLIAVLIGVIIAFLGVVVLRRFGAGYYVSYLVGYGILREMGALMTGIIMAGRTGAAFAAELGSMKITEEIDAYTTLGISPVDHLVLPAHAGPVRDDAAAGDLRQLRRHRRRHGGGRGLLDLTPTQFVGGLLSVVTLSDAALGVFKGGVFGVIIGLAGCMKGLQTGDRRGRRRPVRDVRRGPRHHADHRGERRDRLARGPAAHMTTLTAARARWRRRRRPSRCGA
jgi:phospholipid/cholesterol/gamma-HCH transport system permease protein